mmetsp:Transcript_6341/g.9618  ORF Transcript_6341/g.9618 Transcript_6341/m.9618 type:complete len:202 (-) Transcript_6341:324-929(-)
MPQYISKDLDDHISFDRTPIKRERFRKGNFLMVSDHASGELYTAFSFSCQPHVGNSRRKAVSFHWRLRFPKRFLSCSTLCWISKTSLKAARISFHCDFLSPKGVTFPSLMDPMYPRRRNLRRAGSDHLALSSPDFDRCSIWEPFSSPSGSGVVWAIEEAQFSNKLENWVLIEDGPPCVCSCVLWWLESEGLWDGGGFRCVS